MSDLASIQLDIEGGARAERWLASMARRIEAPHIAVEEIFRLFERDEGAIFDSWGGKFVRTGALRASLTSDVGGALREDHGTTMRFGSDLPYAWYVGRHGKGHPKASPVLLKATEARAVLAGELMLRYIAHGAAGLDVGGAP
jgi:hypothetical protein